MNNAFGVGCIERVEGSRQGFGSKTEFDLPSGGMRMSLSSSAMKIVQNWRGLSGSKKKKSAALTEGSTGLQTESYAMD